MKSPLYVVKAPVDSDGTIKMLSVIKKSRLRFRLLDTPRLDAYPSMRSIRTPSVRGQFSSTFLNESYQNARVHNARCAFIAGLGMATGKRVVMLQQYEQPQPIDYRDVVLSYDHPKKIHELLIRRSAR